MDTNENPYEAPKSEPPRARFVFFKWLNEKLGFGFGLIDTWVFAYGASQMLGGIGLGIFAAENVHNGQVLLTPMTIVACAFIAVGLTGANLSHEILKRRAKRARAREADTAGENQT